MPDRYLDIQKLSEGYQVKMEDGKYKYGKLKRMLTDDRYHYYECDFLTAEKSYDEFISIDGRPSSEKKGRVGSRKYGGW